MDTNNLNSFDAQLDFPQKRLQRRRKLLPWWITAFIWLFLVFFVIMPVAVIMGLLKYNFEISLLGITTHQPISLIGLFLILLFSFKGVIALALWTEKAWAVGLAKVDAIISIVICFLVMGYAIFVQHTFSLRLELIVLFLYYYKMNQLQYDWGNFESPGSTAEVTPETL
jgi:hypothetical protein